ncbi:hypothetical protein [Sphingomonas sp.]|uniref:hypothetical protein n=1 Tax=Sphingomonas sp. TaxID=28214 RepID=UPI0028A905A9|nr:hypothetical protein [Sphingomonas sp.]
MENLHELDTTLLQAITAIEALLAMPCCDVAELSRTRYQTARAVAARRRAMDLLFNAATTEGGARAEPVQAVRAGNLEMRMFYTDHTVAWPTTRAVAQWPDYVVASRKLAQVLRRQIEVERAQFYPDRPSVAA